MNHAHNFIQPYDYNEFQNNIMRPKVPFSKASQSDLYNRIQPWPFIKSLLTKHSNCWLPLQGKLPTDEILNTVRLPFEKAQKSFQEGRTILVRQAQLADDLLNAIAKDFETTLNGRVDLPTGNEGFNWHYDAEEVFIIQIAGYKEFRLIKNTINPFPNYSNMPIDLSFETEPSKKEVRCLLAPGDVLYLPAGYWHKASALRNSLHFSVGVLPN